MAYIRNEGLIRNKDDEKKILSAMRRIEKASKQISEMGYMIYVSAHGSLNVLNLDGRYRRTLELEHEMVVANGSMESTDCGDW